MMWQKLLVVLIRHVTFFWRHILSFSVTISPQVYGPKHSVGLQMLQLESKMQAAMLSHQDTVQCRFNASVLSVTQKDLTLVEKKLCQDVKKLNVFCWFFFFFFFLLFLLKPVIITYFLKELCILSI